MTTTLVRDLNGNLLGTIALDPGLVAGVRCAYPLDNDERLVVLIIALKEEA